MSVSATMPMLNAIPEAVYLGAVIGFLIWACCFVLAVFFGSIKDPNVKAEFLVVLALSGGGAAIGWLVS